MWNWFRQRQEFKFFAILPRADTPLAISWWTVLISRGLLPALFAIAMGNLVGAVNDGTSLAFSLALVGLIFVLFQVLTPLHQVISSNLGSKTAAWLYDELTSACVAPSGMAHLENPENINDLTMARDFDLGISGPPLNISMDFIASGLVEFIGGIASALVLFAYAWWAPLVLGGAWLATHYLLRESGVWKDRNTTRVQSAQRHADYAYKIAVEPPAAKELRMFGMSNWIVDRFRESRQLLHDLRWEATRLREKSMFWCVLLVISANIILFYSMAWSALNGDLELNQMVTFASAAISTSMIAFGGLSWAMDSASAPAVAVMSLHEKMLPSAVLSEGDKSALGVPRQQIKFQDVSFAYPGFTKPVLENFSLEIPVGSSIAIVGQNGAGKTTLAKLLCRLYDTTDGDIMVDGTRLSEFNISNWRTRVAAVFQDFIRFELTLRECRSSGCTRQRYHRCVGRCRGCKPCRS